MKVNRALFLGYGPEETYLIDSLQSMGFDVKHTSKAVSPHEVSGFDLVVSFGYRHIIDNSVLMASAVPIINLHISFLPWNRGAHPVFWAHFDQTPVGVTIHEIDKGVDTGPIRYQKLVPINSVTTTFRQAHEFLKLEIQKLFLENVSAIVSHSYKLNRHSSSGSFHRSVDLPKGFAGWDATIDEEIRRLRRGLTAPAASKS